MKRKLLALLLAALMVTGLVPFGALAEGGAWNTRVASNVQYIGEDGNVHTAYAEHLSSTELGPGWYAVGSVTFIDGRVNVSGTEEDPTCVILRDGFTLTAKGFTVAPGCALNIYAQSAGDSMGRLVISDVETNKAGIGGGGDVTVIGGDINVTGGAFAAGIGGDDSGSGGNISIIGGCVTAAGGENAAGIGGGRGGSGGEISITGGQVTANAGEDAASIGNGKDGSGAVITLDWTDADDFIQTDNSFSGTVNIALDRHFKDEYDASADYYGNDAAIPTGRPVKLIPYNDTPYLDENGIVRHRVDVVPIGEAGSEALGSGWYRADGNTVIDGRLTASGTPEEPTRIILVDGCELNAKGITVASGCALVIYAQSTGDSMGSLVISNVQGSKAGIGGGGEITIVGGAVTVTGGSDSAGIGGNSGGSGGNITILGGTVTAHGGDYGAGIGTGYHGTGGSIAVSGGSVAATGGYFGAGIGGSSGSVIDSITVTGGIVTANGSTSGAGIGAGSSGSVGSITISDASVTARGGYYAAGIGGGAALYDYENDGYIGGSGGEISIGGGAVTATGGENAAGVGGGRGGSGGGISITGGKLTANGGSNSASIGNGRFGSGAVITLDWTSEDDFIRTDKGCSGTVNIAPDKHFTDANDNFADYYGNGVTILSDRVVKLIPPAYFPYLDENEETRYASSPTPLGAGSTSLGSGWFCVNSNIQIDGRITVSGTEAKPTCILLMDGFTLSAPKGITVEPGTVLKIYAQSAGEAMGRILIDNVDVGYAGIGGSLGNDCGSVYIHGGNVTAEGSSEPDYYAGGAGIGGGKLGSGGSITITGAALSSRPEPTAARESAEDMTAPEAILPSAAGRLRRPEAKMPRA